MSLYVILETMPDWLRASHEAANNRGVYPHNGAVRCVMDRRVAEERVAADPDWTSIVRDARKGDYETYGCEQKMYRVNAVVGVSAYCYVRAASPEAAIEAAKDSVGDPQLNDGGRSGYSPFENFLIENADGSARDLSAEEYDWSDKAIDWGLDGDDDVEDE